MPKTEQAQTDLARHTSHIRTLLDEASRQARLEIRQVKNPKVQALLETTAEVLDGLRKAYADFEAQDEPAWR